MLKKNGINLYVLIGKDLPNSILSKESKLQNNKYNTMNVK